METELEFLAKTPSANAVSEDHSDWVRIPVRELIYALFRRRGLLTMITGAGSLLALSCAFIIPKEYTSIAQLMPPDSQVFSSSSALSALSGMGLLSSAGLGSGLMSQRTPGATTIAVLSSRTVEDALINRFDLRRIYHDRLYARARKDLEKHSRFKEDKMSGIITIEVTDRSPSRARDMAQEYINQLNALTSDLSTSSARRERIFLEQELKSIKETLDSSTQQLAQFSSRNATLDLQKQGQATVESLGSLQGELTIAEGNLSALKAEYTDDNVRVRAARGRVAELEAQLEKMSGIGRGAASGQLQSNQSLPSVRELPLLGVKYYDLYRKVTMEEALYESLNKQYELAKVQEAQQIPRIKVLDAPELPEKKSSPPRLLIVVCGFMLSALFGATWIIVSEVWHLAQPSNPTKSLCVDLWRIVVEKSPSLNPSDLE